MTDTFTPLLNLRKQQTGNNQNTWGDLFNDDTITPTENAIAGRASHDVSGLSTLDLSATPLVHQVQVFTGLLTADCVVTVPNLSKRMLMVNSTTGNFYLTIKAATGTTPICLPQGTSKDVVTDGSAGIARMDASEVGEFKYFTVTTAPAGYFLGDGSARQRSGAVDLFNKYNASGLPWGAGNGATTFGTPNLTDVGRFVRSSASGLTVGTYQADMVGPHNHTATGSTSLSIVSDGNHTHVGTTDSGGVNHTHTVGGGGESFLSLVGGGPTGVLSGSGNVNQHNTTDGASAYLHTHTFTTGGASALHSHSGSSASTSVTVNNSTGTETRPVAAVMLPCIRY